MDIASATFADAAGENVILIFAEPDRVGLLVPSDSPMLESVAIAPFAPDLRQAVRAEFDRRVAAGLPVTGQAGAVDLDPDSRQEMVSAVLMATIGVWPEGGFWRLSDNTNLVLAAPRLIALGCAAAAYYQQLFGTRSAMLDAVAAGQAPDPAAGWPEPASFDPAA